MKRTKPCKYLEWGMLSDRCVNEKSEHCGQDNLWIDGRDCSSCQDYEEESDGR